MVSAGLWCALISLLTTTVSLDSLVHFSLEWEEFDHQSSLWWGGGDSSMTGSTGDNDATPRDAIVRRSEPSGLPWRARVQWRGSRRFGALTDQAISHYSGTPWGVSQRFGFNSGNFRLGAQTDKDPFEPDYFDEVRCWVQWQRGQWEFIGGDYHIRAGEGVVLWTLPDFLGGWDTPSQYQPGTGLIPAPDALVNSALRGAAIHWKSRQRRMVIFASNVQLDAVLGPDGRPSRLSRTGLHRTTGESKKRRTVSERLAGAVMESEHRWGDVNLTLIAAGFAANFSPHLKPVPDRGDPFALSGGGLSSGGFGLRVRREGDDLHGEVGRDDRGTTAYSVKWIHQSHGRKVEWSGALFHYPARWASHHSRAEWGGAEGVGLDGGALLAAVKPQSGPIQTLITHVELTAGNWRSYSLPAASLNNRISAIAETETFGGMVARLRWRRAYSRQSDGIEAPIENVMTDKIKIILSSHRLKSTVKWRLFGEAGWGGMSGVRISSAYGGMKVSAVGMGAGSRIQTELRMTLTAFNAADGLPLFLGESDLPDRLSSVRLNGRGVRAAGGIEVGVGAGTWLAIRAARTYRRDSPDGDLEIGISASFNMAVANIPVN